LQVGIDEVGRGCWAGPLVAAAVAFGAGTQITGLNDSKKLSRSQRELLAAEIRASGAVVIGVGWVWPADIDISGITAAVKSAMSQAVQEVIAQLEGAYDTIIIDGNYNFLPELPRVSTLVRADGLIPQVSAASIIAKVARDRYMADIAAREYPGYGFEKHVGYGTARHIEQLLARGITPLHRKSFKPIQHILLQSNQ
jgi:ribonuclease HII